MTISKNSWHYRLYRFITNIPKGPEYLNPFGKAERFDTAVPSSLCPYAWSIFLGLLGFIFIGIVIVPIGALIVGSVWIAENTVGWFRRFDKWAWRKAHAALPHWEHTRKPKPERRDKPSLIGAFVKAKKQKVCPMIELVD